MNRILHIFRKDASRLWPQASAFCALLAGNAGVERWYPRAAPNQQTILVLLTLLLPLACSVLLLALIHEERLVGDRQYWLSRPIPRGELFAAKVLFILVFVNLPVFLYQAYMVATAGLRLFPNATNFLWLQLFFTAVDILPIVALASVTKNMVQAALAALVMAVGVALAIWVWIESFYDLHIGVFVGGNANLAWIEVTFSAAVLILGCVPILLRQYGRRGALLSWILLAATILIAACSFLLPHPVAWAIQMKSSPIRIAPNDFRVSRAYGQPLSTRLPNDYMVELRIPIHIERPAGLGVALESGSVNLVAPSGAVFQASGAEGDTRANGFNSFVVGIDRMSYTRIKDTPVHIYGVLNLTVLRAGKTVPIPGRTLTEVPGVGTCLAVEDRIDCASVRPTARLLPVEGDRAPAGFPVVLAPYPHLIGYSPIVPVQLPISREFQGVELLIQKPVAYIQRSFDFGNVILSDSDRP